MSHFKKGSDPFRVLFFTQSSERGTSSRYRVYQYIPFLREAGWSCRVAPAVPAWLHDGFFFSKNLLWKAVCSVVICLRRLLQLFRVPFADVVFIQKPLLPGGWLPLEALVRKLARRLVFDFDDAIFLPSPFGIRSTSQRLLAKRFAKIAACADLVLAGNRFLADQARIHARRVEVFPTTVDTARFCPGISVKRSVPVIGWMGSPSTALYLEEIREVLKEIAGKYSVRYLFIGTKEKCCEGLPASCQPWGYSTEVQSLRGFDIFIAPMGDTGWEQGKCGLKVLTAMSVGLPIVAAKAGVHNEIIQDGQNGFLAATPAQWKEKLTLLLDDPGLRHRLGREARKTVKEKYSLQHWALELIQFLRVDFKRAVRC